MFELDHKPSGVNLVDTMTRRQENYHSGMDRSVSDLYYDWYRKNCLIDHFLDSDFKLHDMEQCRFKENSDFTVEPFRYGVKNSKNKLEVSFERDGNIWINGEFLPHTLQKRISLEAGSSIIQFYTGIKNQSMSSPDYTYACEFNMNIPLLSRNTKIIKNSETGILHDTGKPQIINNLKSFCIEQEFLDFTVYFKFKENIDLCLYPVETWTNSENGIKKILQGFTMLFVSRFRLQPAGIQRLRYSMEFNRNGQKK